MNTVIQKQITNINQLYTVYSFKSTGISFFSRTPKPTWSFFFKTKMYTVRDKSLAILSAINNKFYL